MATIQSFDALMKGFGVVTVMDACIYRLKNGVSYSGRGACQHESTTGGALCREDFECTGLYLDTLKIANINQEGPTKEVKGGQYANTLIKYGKTTTMEMQDALGRAAVLETFFGCDVTRDENGQVMAVAVTDKFPGPIAIEGKTFFIDQKTGDQVEAYVFIPQFLPDAVLNLTQDAEGDAAVFDLNGSVSSTKVTRDGSKDSDDVHSLFYELRATAWFEGLERGETEPDYHDTESLAKPVITAGMSGATWTAVDNADGYEYVITRNIDGDTATIAGKTTETTKTLTTGDVIQVRAYGDGYSTSGWATFTYIAE